MMASVFKGRRVTDPVPVVRGPTSPTQYDTSLGDLEKAWDKMGKTKTALRRVEHRLDDAARYKFQEPESLNISDSSVTVDRVPSFRIEDRGRPVTTRLDNFGRTEEMRKRTSRKVSRLEDKYTEEPEHAYRARSPIDSRTFSYAAANREGQPRTKSPKRVGFSNRNEYRSIENRDAILTSYSDRIHGLDGLASRSGSSDPLRSGIYDSSRSSGFDRPSLSSEGIGNVTDPRALRETEVRFLNDHITDSRRVEPEMSDFRRYSGSTRQTYVNVTVPGSTYSRPTNSIYTTDTMRTFETGGSHPRVDYGRTQTAVDGTGVPPLRTQTTAAVGDPLGRDHIPGAYTRPYEGLDRASQGYSTRTPGEGVTPGLGQSKDTDTSRSETSGDAKLQSLRKNLKSASRNSEGLAKLREKVMQQRLKASDKVGDIFSQGQGLQKPPDAPRPLAPNTSLNRETAPEEVRGHPRLPIGGSTYTTRSDGTGKLFTKDTSIDQSLDSLLGSRQLHTDEKTVQPKTYDIYAAEKQPMVRKVAAGPPGPTYRGFNEAETKIRTPEGKVVRVSQSRRKMREKKISKESKVAKESKKEANKKSSTKPARVISHHKRPSKYERKDIITTRSWREGQKLVLKELGPNKLPKMSLSPPTKDTEPSSEVTPVPQKPDPVQATADVPEADQADTDVSDNEDFKDSLEPSRAKGLSEQAKHVLADLKSESEDEEDKADREERQADSPHKEKVGKGRMKRKLTKPEPETKFPAAKVRHYDTDEVRRFIAKQKADRKKKSQEEKKHQKEQQEMKKKQLEDLYKKQKKSARPIRPNRVDRHRVLDETFSKGQSVGDLPRRHPFHDDSRKVSTGSDKENREHRDSDEDNLSSSDASTITRDGLEGKQSHRDDQPQSQALSEVLSSTSELTTDIDMSEQLPARMTDFPTAEASFKPVQGQGYQASSLPYQPTVPVSATAATYRTNAASSLAEAYSAGYASVSQPKTKQERISALKEMSMALQSRLHAETRRLIQTSPEIAAASKPHIPTASDQYWAYPRYRDLDVMSTESEGTEEFMTRHDRLTGGRQNYSVFTGDLPGVGSLSDHAMRVEDEKNQAAAATKIQAAYRGHTVRQGLSWRLPSGGTLGSRLKQKETTKPKILDDSSDTSSLLTDTTLTESEGFGEKAPKIGAGLRETGYCIRDLGGGPDPRPEFAVTEPYEGPFEKKRLAWDEPPYDPYSVLSIYTRQYQDRAKVSTGVGTSEFSPQRQPSPPVHSSPSPVYDDDFTHTTPSIRSHKEESHRSQGTAYSGLQRSAGSGSHKSGTSLRSGKTGSYQDESNRTRSKRRTRSPYRNEENLSPGERDDKREEDTLGDSLTQSLESDEDVRESPPSPKPVQSLSLVPSNRSRVDDSLDSDLSSLGDEETRRDPLSLASKLTAGSPRSYPPAETRLAPDMLERRMTAELNLLDGMEESLRHLTDVERARGISMTQQETVSLAQILKGRQQTHNQDMKDLHMKLQQERLESTRQLEEAQRRAAEASREAARAIAEVRGDAATKIQDSTHRLLETQAEAAKATAEAARQLAGVASVSQSATAQALDSNRIASDVATAAASAAVTAALDQQRQQQMDFWRQARQYTYDRSTQVSAAYSAGSRTRSPPTASYSPVSRTRSPPTASYGGDSFESGSKSETEAKTKSGSESASSIRTASDLSDPGRRGASQDTDSPILTASDAKPRHQEESDQDKTLTESIVEDLHSDKTESVTEEIPSDKDYSMKFDESMTEDEIEDQSFRALLPSETHRRKAKKEEYRVSDHGSLSSEEMQISGVLSVSELHAPFHGEDSFSKFTAEMVRQYMKEEEMRAKHQGALFRLREKALEEKMKAELAWLDQQKKQLRDKGSDDAYPQIVKKQRGLIMKYKKEQAEIKRLQEANRIASRERQLLLQQHQEIARLRQSAQQVKSKLKDSKGDGIETTHSEDETGHKDSLQLPEEFLQSHLSRQESKSDTEVYVDSGQLSSRRSPSPSSRPDARVMKELKKLHLDERHLTVREVKLQQRRRHAEELLAWKKRLDQEEREIKKMEQQAVEVRLDDADRRRKGKKGKEKEGKREKDKPQEKSHSISENLPPSTGSPVLDGSRLDGSRQGASGSESSIAEDVPSPVHTASKTGSSIAEDIQTPSVSDAKSKGHNRSESESSIQEEVLSEVKGEVKVKGEGHRRSGSESSVPEEVPSHASSIAEEVHTETPRKQKSSYSSDDTTHNGSANGEYSNDTFESTDTGKKEVSRASKLSKAISKEGNLSLKSPRSPRSPFANRRKSSETSESEESFSYAQSETASDQSDVEGRIRALAEDLKRRKIEAERLKREQKKRHKERLRAQEASLKKQIEAYDNVIVQIKQDLTKELELEPVKGSVKPQIKQPRVAEKKTLHKHEDVPQPETVKQRSESRESSIAEEGKEGGEPGTPVTAQSPRLSPSPQLDDTLKYQSPLRSEASTPTRPSSLPKFLPDTLRLQRSPTREESKSKAEERSRSISEELAKSGSEISEEIGEDIFSPRSEASEKSSGDMILKFDGVGGGSVAEQIYERSRSVKDTARSKSQDGTKKSETEEYDYGEDFTKATEEQTEVQKSLKSVESEIQEDIESEADLNSQKSDASTHSQRSVKSQHSAASSHSQKSWRSQRSESSVRSRKSDVSHKSEVSERSKRSEVSKADSERSKGTRSRSASEASEASYSDDFSSSSEKKFVKSDISRASSRHSQRSVQQDEKTASVGESIHSEDEVSERLSVQSQDSEQSGQMLDLSRTKGAVEDEDRTPVQSPSWLVHEEPRILDTSTPLAEPLTRFSIGDRVLIDSSKPGRLLYKGTTLFSDGIMAGVELDTAEGEGDGTKNGVHYFDCKPMHGVFVTADRCQHLPAEFEVKARQDKEDIEEEEAPSEHTVTEEVPPEEPPKSPEYSDDFDGSEVAGEGQKSRSEGRELRGEGQEAISVKSEEKEESIQEEVSVATDSELERVISSAAQAVEQFEETSPRDVDEHVLSSTAVTPRDSVPEDTRQQGAAPARNLDTVVDKITDSLTAMIIKDSVTVIGKIAEKQGYSTQGRNDSKEIVEKESEGKEKPHTPFLDLLTKEQEQFDESVEDFEEDFQRELQASPETPAVLPAQKADIVPQLPKPSEDSAKTSEKDITTNTVLNDLLNDAISDMLSIRRKQTEKFAAETQTEQSSLKPDTPEDLPKTPVTPDPESPVAVDKLTPDVDLTDEDLFSRVTIREREELQADTPLPARPVSPVFGGSQHGISALDLLGLEEFGGNEWMDDDFGLSLQRQIPDKPPPPYPGTAMELAPKQEYSKLDLQKLTEELFYAVPHKKEEVIKLTWNAVDAFWAARRYGEPFDSVMPPGDYFTSEDRGQDIEATSRRVYKKMIFELVGDLIKDIYADEEDLTPEPWEKPRKIQHRYYKGKAPPTTCDHLKEVVEHHVLNLTGLSKRPKMDEKTVKLGGRKKKDLVDLILVQELREEEPSWVNYDDDELAVKFQLADAIFDSLLVETGKVFTDALQRYESRTNSSN
ncbi:centrosome-associated protein 350 isoform X2 [Lingula anatina]|uniref:Centrosome-associated protein 350 isoform X2 n=1 Tax=Lingula anatina TaxID=7574 RepID=A0A1S3JRM0_LINAN|nr:centrosome-associated protein 350 isoform X2 [Lingula anatina]|eukprot:XP_013412629.1 centrosome-associated protein 350 isoform X2 [Lingula anatina]